MVSVLLLILLVIKHGLVTVIKSLVQGLEDLEIKRRVETIETTPLSRLARILRRVREA